MGRIQLVVVAAFAAAATVAPCALAQPAPDVTSGEETSAIRPVKVQLSRDGRHAVHARAARSAPGTRGRPANYAEPGQTHV
jgi:hypothetical protein